MNSVIDWFAFEYFSNSMNYSFIGFIIGYIVGKTEVLIFNRLRGKRKDG
jgi:hypothetical protein